MKHFSRIIGYLPRKMIFVGRSLALIASLLLVCVGPAFCQIETAAVVGTVTDASGAIVPGAMVTIKNLGTGATRTASTTANGDYVLDLLQVGTYSITVSANGFKTFSTPSLTLSAGDRTRLNAKMEVGSVSQTVEVSAAATVLDSQSFDISSLVSSQAVQDVPLNGRNIYTLVQLQPGVTIGAQGDLSNGGRPNDRRLTSEITVNGQASNTNNNMIDGMDNNARLMGSVQIRPSADAIQEVSVMLNKYDASAGRTAGGVVNVITKSGTNALHGSAYEFFRNAVLNTNPNHQFPANYTGCPAACVLNYTAAQRKPAFRQNQYGGSVGGPIRKDKTFFFVDYEGFANALGVPLTNSVPTLCMRGTKMVALQAAAEGIPVPAVNCSAGNNTVLADPGNFSELAPISLPGGSASTGAAGTGPVIPLASQSAYADALFSLYPLPNAPGLANNYTEAPARVQNSRLYDIKIDHHFSSRDSLDVRYSYNSVTTNLPPDFGSVNVKSVDPYWTGGDLNVVAGGTNGLIPTIATQSIRNIALNYVHTLSASMVLNLKLAYLRNNTQSLPYNFGQSVTTQLGQNCTSANCINYGPDQASGLQQFTITGLTNLGDVPFNPEIFIDNDFQESAQLTWTKGSHSLRAGFSLIRRQDLLVFPNNPEGSMSFTGIYTGVAPGDFLKGLGTAGARQTQVANQSFRTWEPSGYVQDDWRTTRWLTLNLGVRYEIFTPLTEHHGLISNWDPASGLLVSPSLSGANQSNATALIPTTYTNIEPRFGFAVSLPHEMVLRGGFGLASYPMGGYNSFTGGGGAGSFDMQNPPINSVFACTTQNNQSANVPCTGVLDNGAIANYGPATSTSSVGQHGGISLLNGLPVPTFDVSSVVPPSGCRFDTNANYATTCPNNPYNNGIPVAVWAHYTDPMVMQFNLQMQKQFGSNAVSIGYVGELGRHQAVVYKPNAISNSAQNGVAPLAQQYPWLAKSTITDSYAPWGTSSYHSLQATFVRRYSRGLTFSANYSHVKAMSNSNAICQPTVSNSLLGFGNLPGYTNPCFYDNPGGSPVTVNNITGGFYGHGNTGLGVPNRIGATANYELPFGKSFHGIAGLLVKDWSANGAFAWQTGDPFTITTAVPSGTVGSGRPDQICSSKNAPKSLEGWGVNPACFQLAATNTWGNELANQFYGPHHRNIDFSLIKAIPIREVRAQFRVEAFNLFNTPQFSAPATNAGAVIASFGAGANTAGTLADSQNPKNPTSLKLGAITALNTNYNSRQIQFALKFLF